MLREKGGIKKLTYVGIMSAFGVFTVSSCFLDATSNTITPKNEYYYSYPGIVLSNESVCTSSRLANRALGDFMLPDTIGDFVDTHEKISVSLKITKINKYVSNFDFDDEYEEI